MKYRNRYVRVRRNQFWRSGRGVVASGYDEDNTAYFEDWMIGYPIEPATT